MKLVTFVKSGEERLGLLAGDLVVVVGTDQGLTDATEILDPDA